MAHHSFLLILTLFGHFARVLCLDYHLCYNREFLLLLRDTGGGIVDPAGNIPTEIIRHGPSKGDQGTRPTKARKRGSRGGVRQRLKRQGLRRIPLPSIILANVQSLRSKVDELQANARFVSDYRNACLIALTETWLKEQDLQPDLEIDGFGVPLRLDRDPAATGKSLGGGLCLYVNKSWCNTVAVRETVCAPDIELMSVSLCPYYLPREFPQIFVTLVYIHPRANADIASRVIVQTVQRLQSIASDTPNFII